MPHQLKNRKALLHRRASGMRSIQPTVVIQARPDGCNRRSTAVMMGVVADSMTLAGSVTEGDFISAHRQVVEEIRDDQG